MAAKKKEAPVESAPETTEVVKDRAYLQGKVTPVHEGHAAYIQERYGVDVPPEFIFAVYSTRVAYRKTSDQYGSAKEARAAAKEAAAKAREDAKAEKAAAREKAKAEKDAAKKAKADAAAAEKAAAEKSEGKSTKGKGKAEAKPAAASGKKKPF